MKKKSMLSTMPLYASASRKGGVASQIHMATIEGVKMLEDGGNAFDAAITISSILTVLLPNLGGIGGDGFLLALDSGDEIVAYNGSGRSSQEFQVDQYLYTAPVRGPLTITVPGLVDLWEWVSENYATRDLKCLLDKAISLAANGFCIQESLAEAVKTIKPILGKYESWNMVFNPMKRDPQISFPKLSEIYEFITRLGSDAFYRSRLTEEIVDNLRRESVPITYDDFAQHRGEKMTPLKCEYRDYDLFELPPNTQGLTTLQLMKAIEVEGLNKMPFESSERIAEFLRLAVCIYEDRDKHIADPAFYRAPTNNLLSETYLRHKFSQEITSRGKLKPNDTTFFVVGDRYGNLVGFIQSLFASFGSGIVIRDIPFQNRGAGFSKRLGLSNSPGPRKRPLHTLSILLARHDRQGDFMIGCAGGDLRPQIHSEILTNIADYAMSLSGAVEAPRYNLVAWRKGEPRATIERNIWSSELPRWVEKVEYQSASMGRVHAGRKRLDGVFESVADPRGGGISAPSL